MAATGAKAGDRVLDAGCGTGEYSLALARLGLDVVAADVAAGMLSTLRRKLAAEADLPVSVEEAHLSKPWADGRFDWILAVSVVQALPTPAFALFECCRVLRPGGTLVLVHRSRPAPGRRVRGLFPTIKAAADRLGAASWSADELGRMFFAAGSTAVTTAGDDLLLVAARRPAPTYRQG